MTYRSSLVLGQTLQFASDPFEVPPDEAALHLRRGGVLVRNGVIADIGDGEELKAANPDAEVRDFGAALVVPGFIDCHAHYPQTGIIASWGRRLIDWLNTYTFPEEMRFVDSGHARDVADLYLDLCLANGTTTISTFCTIHPGSVDAVFEAAEARGMCIAAGKVMMDRNAPEGLRDTASGGYDESKQLMARWHGRGRAVYAVTPRFAPTSSPAQLAAAGALWAEQPGTLLQTHLAEQPEEIAWVQSLFPGFRDYLDIYEHHGLVGPGAIMGHAIHLGSRERNALLETGTGVAHCPTSNMFIGSGLCDVAGLRKSGVDVGLGTDVGGGSSFSMLATMRAAYEVAQLRGDALHPAQLLWLATEGSARVMRLAGTIGRLGPGADADICVLDPGGTPVLAQRTERAEDIWEVVHALIMLGDDRAVRQVFVAGEPVAHRLLLRNFPSRE